MSTVCQEHQPTPRTSEQRYRDNIRTHIDRLSRVLDEVSDEKPPPDHAKRWRRSKSTALCIATQMLSSLHTAIETELERRDSLRERLESVGRQVQCDSCPVVHPLGRDNSPTSTSDPPDANGYWS